MFAFLIIAPWRLSIDDPTIYTKSVPPIESFPDCSDAVTLLLVMWFFGVGINVKYR